MSLGLAQNVMLKISTAITVKFAVPLTDPSELINPQSVISGATPIEKESEHFFFRVPMFSDMLKKWTRSGTLQNSVSNKVNEWLDDELQEWDISRDKPYFGFEIPKHTRKVFLCLA